MALVRWQPREMADLRSEMNHLIDSFWGNRHHEQEIHSNWIPATDVTETDEEIVVTAELPGMRQEDVKVTVANNVLTIQGEKKNEVEHKEGDAYRTERTFGSFSRSFTLSAGVNADKIEAKVKDGVLTLRVPKPEEVKAKQIEVKVS